MEQEYIEKMAREYAELLRAHQLKRAETVTVPSEARVEYLELSRSQLRAIAYLKSIVKNTVKKRLLLTIEKELLGLFSDPITIKKIAYSSAENAVSALIDKELSKLELLQSVDMGEYNTTKKYFLLTLISLLSY